MQTKQAWIVVNRQTDEIWNDVDGYFSGNLYAKKSSAEYIANGRNIKDETDNWVVREATLTYNI